MDKVINPQTGRQIKIGGVVYHKLVKQGLITENQMDQWEKLPIDILLLIFDQMEKQDILNLCEINKSLHKRCSTERIQNYINNIPDIRLPFKIKYIGSEDYKMKIKTVMIHSDSETHIIIKQQDNKFYTLYLPLFGEIIKNSSLEILSIEFNGKIIKELKFDSNGSGVINLKIPKNAKYNEIYCIPNRWCFKKQDLEKYFDLNYQPFGINKPKYKIKDIDSFIQNYQSSMTGYQIMKTRLYIIKSISYLFISHIFKGTITVKEFK